MVGMLSTPMMAVFINIQLFCIMIHDTLHVQEVIVGMSNMN